VRLYSRNGKKGVAGAASEAFVRWLLHRYTFIEGRWRGHIFLPRDTLLQFAVE